jgi:hypothetical protein
MTITLFINGTDRTSSIIRNSLNKSDVLNEKVDTLSFAVEKYGSYTYAPAVNDTVELLDTGVTIFKGLILTVDKSTDGHSVVRYDCQCVDNAHFLNRILVTETYTNTTIDAIIASIILTYAPTFTTVNVDAPIAVETITFNRISVSEALQKLSRLSNYSWYVDYTNDIHFFAKNTELAPFSITDTSNNYIYESLEVTEDISQLRNRVLIQGGEAEGDERTELFDGNGTKKFFPLSNKWTSAPTVTVGGVAQTVGVDYLDDEADFNILWSFQEKYLKFTTAPAAGTNNIVVTGIPLYSILVQVEDRPSIDTYGVAEFSKTDTTITSKVEARDFAIAELEAYAEKVSEASFSTYTPGLRSGQTITVNSTQRGVNENFLIQKVTFRMVSPTVGIYQVELATLKTITLIDFLISQLRANGTILKDTENLLLQKFLTFTDDSVTLSDSVTVQALNYATSFRLAPQSITTTLRPFILDGSRIV